MRLHLHNLSEVLESLGRKLEDVRAAPGAARFLYLLEGAAELLQLAEVVIRLELERHEAVVDRISRELHGTRVTVEVLGLS